jgi:hypothetical protein
VCIVLVSAKFATTMTIDAITPQEATTTAGAVTANVALARWKAPLAGDTATRSLTRGKVDDARAGTTLVFATVPAFVLGSGWRRGLLTFWNWRKRSGCLTNSCSLSL